MTTGSTPPSSRPWSPVAEVDLVRAELVAAALAVGVVSLAVATTVATRHRPADRGARLQGLAPLVPWVGAVLVLVLLVRGSVAGAVVVLLLTILHAALTRLRTSLPRRGSRGRRPPT